MLVCGLGVLVVDTLEDADIVRMALERHWDTFSVRMVTGHALRELLVIMALIGLATRAAWTLPFVLGAGLHGLFLRSGYFIGAEGIPWTSFATWFVVFDMVWRAALLVWVAPRLLTLFREEVDRHRKALPS